MSKITFLFGAGASRNCLPIVNEIPNRLFSVIDILDSTSKQLGEEVIKTQQIEKTERNLQIELINDLRWLYEISNNHASIDTAAKKLFIKGDDSNLLKLKIGLSIFLIVEQILNPPDKRYDSFFASILGSTKSDFPQNIRIISWNYDHQFELSFMDYINDNKLDSARGYINFANKFDYLRNNDNIQRFGIFKLNGHPGIYNNEWRNGVEDLLPNLDGELDVQKIRNLVSKYALLKYNSGKSKPALSFAWEEIGNEINIIDKAINNVLDTTTLVVIGYSFPFFNRNIDRKIIQSMSNLKKIYLQSPEANALKDRLNAIRDTSGIELLPISDTQQFILPHEL